MIEPPIVFTLEELLPKAWQDLGRHGPVRTFNPGLLPLLGKEEWLLAYRVVGADGVRRIGVCRLDRRLRIVQGSACPWSDGVTFAEDAPFEPRERAWFADPRLYRLGGKCFLYWNTGWHEPFNRQFLQEFDERSLAPLGFPRELRLVGKRRPLEKNWMLFDEDRAVYSVRPHRVLRFSLEGSGPIDFAVEQTCDWDDRAYASRYGELRGGAPPQPAGDEWFAWCHSVYGVPQHYRYVPALYSFSAKAPFAPARVPLEPADWPIPSGVRRREAKLNPAVGDVVYPCGAALDAATWIVSYGIDDERCAISRVPHAQAVDALRRLPHG